MFNFEKLNVYKKAEKLYEEINLVFLSKTNDIILYNQLKRACLSTILNIAEGAGRSSRKDKKHFYTMSRGSLFECASIFNIMLIEKYINSKELESLKQNAEVIGKMLTGLIKNLS